MTEWHYSHVQPVDKPGLFEDSDVDVSVLGRLNSNDFYYLMLMSTYIVYLPYLRLDMHDIGC